MGLLFLPPKRLRQTARRGGAGLLFAAAACAATVGTPRASHAQQVTATYTQGSGFFNYNFTVFNNTLFEIFDVSIALPTVPVSTALTTAQGAPAGFQTTVDNGQSNGTTRTNGFIDFSPLAGSTSSFFAGSTVRGFLVRSPLQLNGLTFTTLDASPRGGSTGTVVTTVAAAPEPGTLGLLAFSGTPAAAALLAFRRRRFISSASLKG